jgi:hypothetical protein
VPGNGNAWHPKVWHLKVYQVKIITKIIDNFDLNQFKTEEYGV